jgi:1-acyl-sn-glycerol-3-phosphate acyltransferase
MRMEVQGKPPRPPFLLVSNHLSYVDVVVLASQLGAVFVARGDVAGWPVAGAMCRAADTIFVDRDNRRDVERVLRRMEEMLRQGRGVVLFAEGTSSAGQTVLPFRPSLLAAAARSGLPVFHASLTYVAAPGGPSPATTVCWWGDMTMGRHVIRLFRLPGFSVKVRFGERAIRENDRKILAGKLHEAVCAQFEPVSAEVSPEGISGRLTAGPAGDQKGWSPRE